LLEGTREGEGKDLSDISGSYCILARGWGSWMPSMTQSLIAPPSTRETFFYPDRGRQKIIGGVLGVIGFVTACTLLGVTRGKDRVILNRDHIGIVSRGKGDWRQGRQRET